MRHIVVISWLISLVSIASCGDICSDQRLRAAESEDRRLVAVLDERDCGATTDFVRTVSFEAGQDASDILKARLALSPVVIRVNGRGIVDVGWRRPKQLVVMYDKSFRHSDLFDRASTVVGITITLEEERQSAEPPNGVPCKGH